MARRRKNPLVRKEDYTRSDKFFVVATEDTIAAKAYFNLFKLHRIQIVPLETKDGMSAPRHVLNRVDEVRKEYLDEDEMWISCDTDRYAQGTHLREYTSVLSEAQSKGVHVAISRPCFELWLLLHHNPDIADLEGITNCRSVEPIFRKYLPSFSKNTIKPEDYTFPKIVNAVKLAKQLDDNSRIPQNNNSQMYRLIIDIIKNCPRSSLPEDLIEIKDMPN